MKETTENLIVKANEIVKYYYKGFGNSIMGANDSIELFMLTGGKKGREYFDNIMCHPLLHYESIPFENLHGKEEFYPLFVTRDMLLRYYSEACKNFDEPHESIASSVQNLGKAIVEVGWIYNDTLMQTLSDIREDSRYKDFRIKIYDDKGDIFHF